MIALLPGLIAAQILVVQVPLWCSFFCIIACVLFLVKAKSFLGTVAGLALGLVSALSLQAPLNNTSVSGEHFAYAKVSATPPRYPAPGSTSFSLEVLRLDPGGEWKNANVLAAPFRRFYCRTISLPWKNSSKLVGGEIIAAQAQFEVFPLYLPPWRYEASLQRRGFSGTCRIRHLAILATTEADALTNFERELRRRYVDIVGGDEIAALMLSLSLGVRDVLSTSSEAVFKDLGIAHVLVLSGMQIGLIFFASGLTARIVLRRLFALNLKVVQRVANFVAAGSSGLLVHLTHYEASAARSWISCVLIAFAYSREREAGVLRGSLAALLVLCLIWPGCWAEAGVQLSFAALFGIALGSDLASTKFQSFFFPCLFATVCTSIVSACWFGTFPLAALFANTVLAPWFGVVGCYLGLTLVVACYLHLPLVEEFAMLCRWLTQLSLDLIRWFHHASPPVLQIHGGEMLCFASVVLLVMSWRIGKRVSGWGIEFNLYSRR